jgi:hypothetical protein
MFKGEASYTCKGCLNWDPIVNVDKYVVGEEINCFNFREAEDEKKEES